jgi:hypothetical protein
MNTICLEELKRDYPNVTFTLVNHKWVRRHENAFYPSGYPKPELIHGCYIKMENIFGGTDIVSAANSESVHELAAWHQSRAS